MDAERVPSLPRRPQEQELVLEVLQRYPTRESLNLAAQTMKDPQLKDQATAAVLAIAQALSAEGHDLREQLEAAGLEPIKLEIVKAEYGAGSTHRDVTAILKKQAGDFPLITLPSATYNQAFGGDPVPGTAKQLKIEYRINGKSAEVTLPENAPILLPLPRDGD